MTDALNNFSWAEIDEIGQSGFAPQVFSVHDTKDISVSGETLTMEIVGFNHDDLTSGGKAAITFGTKNLMTDKMKMHLTATNNGGFTTTDVYIYLNGIYEDETNLYYNLPEDLRAAIKTVNKKTSAGRQSTSINTDAMNIFLFSVIEVSGTNSIGFASNEEGTQYAAFSNNETRVKKLSNGSGNAHAWWLRSPDLTDTNSFCCVDQYGQVGAYQSTNANRDQGVCFGFCV